MGLIAPNGKRKVQWDWFMLALVFYTGITVPFGLAFYAFADLSVSPFGFAVDCIVDICYIVDVFVSWRTTYYDRDGLLVLDKKLARQHYVRTWFPLDVIASFPYEPIGDLATINSSVTVPPSVRLPSILKLLRIVRLGKKIDRLSSSKMFRIGQFTFMLLIFAHWYACIWFWQGKDAEPDDDDGIVTLPGHAGTSWVFRLSLEDESVAMQYTASLYWAITTLMKSPWFHPASPGEFVSALLMIICGCVLFAYFIGNVTAVITAANASGGRYRAQIAELKSFCVANNLSHKLTHKLLVYQEAQWTETDGGMNRADIVKRYVPSHLLPHVAVEMHKPLLSALPFLLDCTASCTVGFLSALKICVCDRGDVLMVAGSMRRTMYVLQKGEIKVEYEPKAAKETLETYAPDARIGAKKIPKSFKKSAKDNLRGRTDKMGTLLGFADVFKKIEPLEYTVTATKRSIMLAITRSQLKELLTTYEVDQEHFAKAIEHANTQIKNSSKDTNIRRSATERISQSDMSKAADEVQVLRTPSTTGLRRGSTLALIEAEHAAGEQAAKEARNLREATREAKRAAEGDDSTRGEQVLEGVSSDEVDDLRRKLDTLTKIVSEQFRMIEHQSDMIAKLVTGQQHVEQALEHDTDEPGKGPKKKRESVQLSSTGAVEEVADPAHKVAVLMG